MSRTNRDHAKKNQRPMIEDAVIAEQLETLLIPTITAQKGCYRELGLRNRILTLPLMVAAVITLVLAHCVFSEIAPTSSIDGRRNQEIT